MIQCHIHRSLCDRVTLCQEAGAGRGQDKDTGDNDLRVELHRLFGTASRSGGRGRGSCSSWSAGSAGRGCGTSRGGGRGSPRLGGDDGAGLDRRCSGSSTTRLRLSSGGTRGEGGDGLNTVRNVDQSATLADILAGIVTLGTTRVGDDVVLTGGSVHRVETELSVVTGTCTWRVDLTTTDGARQTISQHVLT